MVSVPCGLSILQLKLGPAAYAVAVRTSEFDLPPEMLDDLVAQTGSHATDHNGFGDEPRRKRARNDDADYGDLDQSL